MGDAAHAMTPNMGQGANMGLEDVCELVHRLVPVLSLPTNNNNNSSNTVLTDALTAFGQARHARVAAVHEQSRQNAIQSKTFDKDTAATPFVRRKYTATFKKELYQWKPPT